MSVMESRPALERLLRDDVELYQLGRPHHEIGLAAALAIVADPTSWVPSQSGMRWF